jgi:hypothetical protein
MEHLRNGALGGYAHPCGIRRAVDRYAHDADAVRDGQRACALAELGVGMSTTIGITRLVRPWWLAHTG